MITAAPDTTLQDGRAVCVIRAYQLEPGDVIVKHECIDLRVLDVRHPTSDWVVADYACTAGSGTRSLVAHSFIAIQPRTENEEAPH